MVHQCDATWNQILPSIELMYERLVEFGFIYCDGEIVVSNTLEADDE